LPADAHRKLDEESQLETAHPYMFFEDILQSRIRGGTKVRKWS
jgi:hypothetical protein